VLVAAQRPPTAKGVAFLTIEDVWGLVNVVLYPDVYEAYRPVLRSRFVLVEGVLQNQNGAINILACQVRPLKMSIA
jgi:error-prone DNA polymerase